MDKPKVAIITRARNRLEYTIRCVNAVRNFCGYENYEHIVISQDSTDGTQQWLDWIARMPNNWFDKVRPFHPGNNIGDYGGMVFGCEQTDAELVMQLDNDIQVTYPNWLDVLVQAFQEVPCVAMMLRRTGVRMHQGPKPYKKLTINGEEHTVGSIPRPVACFITHRQTILDNPKLRQCDGLGLHKDKLILKLGTVTAEHIEGHRLGPTFSQTKYIPENGVIYNQRKKYDRGQFK